MMNNREIAEAIWKQHCGVKGFNILDAVTKALDIKDDHATEVQTKLLTQITTLRGALEVASEDFCRFYDVENDLEDSPLKDIYNDFGIALAAVPPVLATSQGDTEGNILAGNEAVPSGPVGTIKARFIDKGPAECPEYPLPDMQGGLYEALLKISTMDNLNDPATPYKMGAIASEALAAVNEALCVNCQCSSNNDRVMDLIRAARMQNSSPCRGLTPPAWCGGCWRRLRHYETRPSN